MGYRRKHLTNRPLFRKDYPTMWDKMKSDGIWCQVTRTGYAFYVGPYKVSNTSICEVWGISLGARS